MSTCLRSQDFISQYHDLLKNEGSSSLLELSHKFACMINALHSKRLNELPLEALQKKS